MTRHGRYWLTLMGKRIDLPASLQYLTAKELLNYFRRAIREGNRNELRTIKAEYDRRGIRLQQKDHGAYMRITTK